jgi:cyclopropane-fatty-acyl-phospholipid synthase
VGSNAKTSHSHSRTSGSSSSGRRSVPPPSTAPASVAAAAPGLPQLFGSLDEAQVRKLDHIIRRANIKASHRVLDVGCGWGGLAIRIAQTTGCRVHGITLSQEQLRWAQRRINALGLQDQITLEFVDYRDFARDHPAEFDRVVSVEMVEAVGANHLDSFVGACARLLKPDGRLVMQAITMPESRWEAYIRSADFINTVIFPGGCCPSVHSLLDAAKRRSNLVLSTMDDFTQHYAQTLRCWQRNFEAALPRVRALGFDHGFVRCWIYYLTYCQCGFESQLIGLQVLTFRNASNTLLTATA